MLEQVPYLLLPPLGMSFRAKRSRDMYSTSRSGTSSAHREKHTIGQCLDNVEYRRRRALHGYEIPMTYTHSFRWALIVEARRNWLDSVSIVLAAVKTSQPLEM